MFPNPCEKTEKLYACELHAKPKQIWAKWDLWNVFGTKSNFMTCIRYSNQSNSKWPLCPKISAYVG